MIKLKFGFVACLFFSFSVFAQKNYTQFVNPFIGTGGHGHTYPGATVPFGAVQLSPDTRLGGWDGSSGYHYSDSIIFGFSHTHLSGTGIGDLCDLLFSPMSGKFSFDNSVYSSRFHHKNEKASPGFYSVLLDDDHIEVELTATEHSGFHKYTFSKSGENNIILDLHHRSREDKVIESSLKIISNTKIEGMRRSEAWSKNQYVFFVAEFSKSFDTFQFSNNDSLVSDSSISGTNLKSAFIFNLKENQSVLMKVGISTVSIEGARKNLKSEIPDWNFEKVKNDAAKKWNKQLSKIEITGGTKDQLTIFYTALYHTMIVPVVNMDVDSLYRARDNNIYKADNFTNYSIFSLWDTFRAAHPLYTIIEPKRTGDFISTFLDQYDKGGRLPVWELLGYETDCMIGYHSVSVITDAYAKGIRGFDTGKALTAMVKSAEWNHLGIPALMDHGFLSVEDEHESVSKALEYSYDDWCISQFADMTGNQNEYRKFSERAQYYKNMFDPVSGFMRPRKNGDWITPFNPSEVNNNFTEGNSWQYSFFVPQDISGLISLHGGKDKFESKIDMLFSADTKLAGRQQVDITGMIGQYSHGNEPSHHMAYLYNFVGRPWKTQFRVHQILDSLYSNSPDGLSGNEDCGQMSAWYVLSAMGFYQVTPGQTQYVIGSPLFPKVKISLDNGNTFIIESDNVSARNFYIQSAELNGEKYLKSFFDHADILKGGTLSFKMGSAANLNWGSEPGNYPKTEISENLITRVPIISSESPIFRDKEKIELLSHDKDAEIFYTLDGSQPTSSSLKYNSPFFIDTTSIVKSKAINRAGKSSFVVTGSFQKFPNDWSVLLKSSYNRQYTAGGDLGLIDGIRGFFDWRKGGWQGYQYQDFEVIVDLKKSQLISEVGAGFLQDSRSWILYPKYVEFEVSEDGIHFSKVLTLNNTMDPKDNTVQVSDFKGSVNPTKGRFLKVKAFNFGTLPEWHQGHGDGAFIFVDEIWVK